jgi:hypothetical protein
MKQVENSEITRALEQAGREARLGDLSPRKMYETRRLVAEALARRADGRTAAEQRGVYPLLRWAAAAAVLAVAGFMVFKTHSYTLEREAAEEAARRDMRHLDFHIERQRAAVARDMARWQKQYLAEQERSFFDRSAAQLRSRIELCAAGIEEELK